MYKITPLFLSDRNWSHSLLLTPFVLLIKGNTSLLSFILKPIIYPSVGLLDTFFFSKENRNSLIISKGDQIRKTNSYWSTSKVYLVVHTNKMIGTLNNGISADIIMY